MYNDFSSMPPEQERAFVVFEQRTRESSRAAFRIGVIVAGLYGLLMVIIVMSYDKPPPLIAEEDIAVTEHKRRDAPAPAPDEDVPAPAATDTAPAAGGPAGEAAPGEASGQPVAPPPPPGATKASPADLVKANK